MLQYQRVGTTIVPRTFEQRLRDFQPELATFLRLAWNGRKRIDLRSRRRGVDGIYKLYTGNSTAQPLDEGALRSWLGKMRELATNRETWVQDYPLDLHSIKEDQIAVSAAFLWTTFYHFYRRDNRRDKVTKRVYVHAANEKCAFDILKRMVSWLDEIDGFRQVKVMAPGGINRSDTIVAFCTTSRGQREVAERLVAGQRRRPRWFTDPLPGLVRRIASGVGIADEPPAIEIVPRGGRGHSFGSFYATLAWVGLRNTPNITRRNPDGRHFLDNVLSSLRVLQVSPTNHHRFPSRAALEKWQRTATRR